MYNPPFRITSKIIDLISRINEQKVTTKVTIKVTINQQKIIEAVKQNPFITQEELVNVVKISRKSIIQNMKKLQENGLLKRIGSNKNGRWQVEA